MTHQQLFVLVFAGFDLVVGLVAAGYWLAASKVEIRYTGPVESGDPDQRTADWNAAHMQAFIRSSALNAKAAKWTAAAVVLATVTTVVSTYLTYQ